MWKKDMNKEGRTRITQGENLGLTLESIFLQLKESREEMDCPERYKVS